MRGSFGSSLGRRGKEPGGRRRPSPPPSGGPASAAAHREMSPAFLEEMLELRMQIEELRQEGVRSSAELDSLECQLHGRRERLVEDLAGQFAEFESLAAADARRVAVLRQIREL